MARRPAKAMSLATFTAISFFIVSKPQQAFDGTVTRARSLYSWLAVVHGQNRFDLQ